mgnify:FL=1
MTTIKLEVKKAGVIPPIDNLALQVSEWYWGKTKVIGGEIKRCLVAYDFKFNKWLFSRAGHVELIEYYIEIQSL